MFLFSISKKNEIFGISASISMYMCMFPPSFQLLLHKYMYFLEVAIISFIGTMFQGNRHYCLNSLSFFMQRHLKQAPPRNYFYIVRQPGNLLHFLRQAA